MFERTSLEIKELFTQDELADMIDEVVTQPPYTVQFLFGTFLQDLVALLLNLPTAK